MHPLSLSKTCSKALLIARLPSFPIAALACMASAATVSQAWAQPAAVESLWSNNCQRCHGEHGEGTDAGAPSLISREKFDQTNDRPYFDRVKDGDLESGMPAFGTTLENKQMWALVNYVRELQNTGLRAQFGSISSKLDSNGACTTQHAKFKFQTIVSDGLKTPWAIDWLPAKPGQPLRMIITNRGGTLNVFEVASGQVGENGVLSDPIEGTPQSTEVGQGGLLDVTVHPDYADAGNGWIYLTFTKSIKGRATMTTLVRGRIEQENKKWIWKGEQTLWECKPEHAIASGLHFGSRIVFGPKITEGDGAGKRHLYFTIGERGQAQHAQDVTRPNGKVHRIYDDGSIPTDNPFVETPDAYASIFSYGHRNPQGLVFGTDGSLWDTEHAPRGGDEFNQILKGRNYGWPVVTYGINYPGSPWSTPWPEVEGEKAVALNIMMPVTRWMPSIATCGLCVVQEGPQGEAFPDWRGDFLAGGLAGESVHRIRVSKNSDGSYALVEREEILQGMGRVRDVECAPDGSVFVVIEGADKIIRLVPVK